LDLEREPYLFLREESLRKYPSQATAWAASPPGQDRRMFLHAFPKFAEARKLSRQSVMRLLIPSVSARRASRTLTHRCRIISIFSPHRTDRQVKRFSMTGRTF
jgi:hypothetical protein